VIGFDAAQALLAGAVVPLPAEEIALAEACGRVLAEPVHAALSAPRHDVAAMDGYALRDADAAVGARFRVIGESFAGGAFPPAVRAGEAVRIFTGAPMPEGADRVVMQENCAADGAAMAIAQAYGPGWHVRKEGSDFARGDLLLPAGRLLDPLGIVALAAADRASALVHRSPRLAVIATGDELAPPGSARHDPRTIPESVSFGVAGMAAQHGARLVARHTGADDLVALQGVAGAALSGADIVIVTGGASVGERDFAKAMFAPHGLDILFSKVAIKPGKPVWLGRAQGRWVLGLPGNPTSALVTARLFLVPLLAALQGRGAAQALAWESLPLAAGFSQMGNRTTFLRARRVAGALVVLDNQDSAAQAALAAADWLVRCDPGDAPIPPGGLACALRF